MTNYLNNAGASIVTQSTLDLQVEHLRLESKVGAAEAAKQNAALVERFYSSAAALLNADDVAEIAFMDSASRAWDAVVYGLTLAPGDEIVTLSTEFGTNLVSLFHRAEACKAIVRVVRCDANGNFDLNELQSRLNNSTRAIAISHVAAHGSIRNPVEDIGKIATEHGLFYLVDGCQAAGQIDIDVKALRCDAYTVTGRKWLRGPRGTGMLYIRAGEDRVKAPFVDLASADLIFDPSGAPSGVSIRSDARRFELWERSVAGVVGLGNAITEYIESDRQELNRQIIRLAGKLRSRISVMPHIELIGNSDTVGTVGLRIKDDSVLHKCKQALEANDIAYSAMSDWDAPLHFPVLGVTQIIRLSPHYYTSDEAVDRAIEALQYAVEL